MTDAQLREKLLNWYYQRRREGYLRPKPEDFDGAITDLDITRITRDLYKHGLVEASYSADFESGPYGDLYHARIDAPGIDVVEGTVEAPISISVDGRTFNISGSHGFQVGDHNTQHVEVSVQTIAAAIDEAEATAPQKKEAKSKLKEFLRHPAIIQVLGEGLARIPI